MATSITEARKRYNISTNKELMDILTQNLEALNSDEQHCYMEGKKWVLDDIGLERLDQIMLKDGKAAPAPQSAKIGIAEGITTKAGLQERNASLLATNAQLQKENDELRETLSRYRVEYEKVQTEFLALREGHGSVNSTLMRSLKVEAENLRTKLAHSKEQRKEEVSARDQRIRELEERIDSLQTSLTDASSLQAEKLRTEHELLESRKEQDKLLKDLRTSENRIAELESAIEDANGNKREAMQSTQILQNEVMDAAQKLSAVIAQIEKACAGIGSLDLLADDSEIEKTERKPVVTKTEPAETAEPVPEKVENTTPFAISAENAEHKILDQRERALEAIRQEQGKLREEEKRGNGGLLSFLRNKAAAFF